MPTEALQELLARASEQYESGDLEGAQASYFEALKRVDSEGTADDKLTCLDGLASSYFELKSYLEARAVYQQLVGELSGREDGTTRVGILLRHAQSTAALDDLEGASTLYRKVLDVAEKELEPGSELLTEIYSSYGNLLRKARLEPEKLSVLEEKERQNRRFRIAAAEATRNASSRNKSSQNSPKSGIVYTDEYEVPKSAIQRFQDLSSERPTLALLVLFSPIILAGLSLVAVIALSLAGFDIGASKLPTGTEYLTRDSSLSLRFASREAVIEAKGKKKQIPVRVLNRWSQTLSLLAPTGNSFWITPEGASLSEQDGARLYPANAPIFGLIEAMKSYARFLGPKIERAKSYAGTGSNGGGPSTRSDAGSGLGDPERGTDVGSGVSDKWQRKGFSVTTKYFDAPTSSIPLTLFRQVENGEDSDWSGLENSDSPYRGGPIELVALVPASANSAVDSKPFFIVVPFDSAHNRIKTADGSRTMALLWQKGSVEVIAQDTAVVSGLSTASSLAYSERSKESVKARFGHLIAAIVIFLGLIPLGSAMLKPLKESQVHWKYRERRMGNYSQGMTVSLFLLICLIYMSYVVWIVYG